MKKLIKNIISILLIIVVIFSFYKVISKQINLYKNQKTYNSIKKEKEAKLNSNKEETTENHQQEEDPKQRLYNYLKEEGYDWIQVSNTKIDYPIMYAEDNDFYLTHDIEGAENQCGAIFYNADYEPYTKLNTTIYGHSMKNGSMFGTLHYLKNDESEFRKSILRIDTSSSTNLYVPLGIYSTENDFIHYKLNRMNLEEAIQLIRSKSIYQVNTDYDINSAENIKIISLITCDYSISKNGRLIVFYITKI